MKIWNKVYLGALDWEFIYAIITNISPLILKVGKTELKPKVFSEIEKFIENVPVTNELINVKTYLNWQPIHLLVKYNDEYIFINYKGQQLYRKKDFALTDIVWLYMESNKVNKIDILFALLGFNKEVISSDIKKELEILSDKIDWYFVFKQLWINKDIEMFTS